LQKFFFNPKSIITIISIHMFITTSFKLVVNREEKNQILKLMRNFSSAVRFSYKRLLEGFTTLQTYTITRQKFPELNSHYVSCAVEKAREIFQSCKARGQNPKKLIFGGRTLFEKLKKNHLQGKRLKELKRKWKEKRQGTLLSIGAKHKTHKGNLNLRFIPAEKGKNNLWLRIALKNRKFILARVKRDLSGKSDKWALFLAKILSGEQFPYTVELKLKDGQIYGFVKFLLDVPPQTITKEKGVIGIDVNARPFHLALAEVSTDGNLQSYKSIYLSHLLKFKSRNRKEYEEWLIAHEVVRFAKEKNKAIAIEDIKKLPKGKRGDGKAKLRKILQFFSYRRILKKIESLAIWEGIEIVKVNPAFTSVIGMMKYCPQYFIDKDIAGAYVIGRKALGFKEEIPKNYKKLLKSQVYIQYALWRLGKMEEELAGRLNEEKNKYKANGIKRDLRRLKREKKFLEKFLMEMSNSKSSQSEPETQEQGNLGKEPVRGEKSSQKLWRVLRVAFAIPLLGRLFVRDFSPLRPLMVQGKWEGIAERLGPDGFAGPP
jgi:IS605 OrfB family transposase